MSTALMNERMEDSSPQFRARIAGIFYVLSMVWGILSVTVLKGSVTANLIGVASYTVVTLLLYWLFKPVNRNLSLLAALISLTGLTFGALALFRLATSPVQHLVYFGVYCLLIGYLIWKSTFLPRALGPLIAFAGLAWLTFLYPPLEKSLDPYVFAAGIIGEGALMVWLLVFGVNGQRWKEQASASSGAAPLSRKVRL